MPPRISRVSFTEHTLRSKTILDCYELDPGRPRFSQASYELSVIEMNQAYIAVNIA
jgi:hypothetical protein